MLVDSLFGEELVVVVVVAMGIIKQKKRETQSNGILSNWSPVWATAP